MRYSLAGIALGFFLLAIPSPSYASSATFFGPIVPQECHCENQPNPDPNGAPLTTAPDYGCVLQVIQNLINFAVSFSIILFVIYLAIGGFRLVTSGGSSEARSQAKQRLLNVIVGLSVLLCSWLIVDFVMKTLYNPGTTNSEGTKFGPWNSILAGNADPNVDRCIVAKLPNPIANGAVSANLQPISSGSGDGSGTGAATGAGSGSTRMNVPSATQYMQQRYSTTKPGGNCWVGVRMGICKGGLTQFCSGGMGNAYQVGPSLTAAGFSVVYNGTYAYPSSERSFAYMPGDVIIFNKVPGHDNGHATMYVGNNTWISDYTQGSVMSSNRGDYAGGSFTVYRP